MRKFLILLLLIAAIPSLTGCAALWVTDKAVGTAWFATKTTAKAGATAAKLTWNAGSAAVDAVGEDDEEKDTGGDGDD